MLGVAPDRRVRTPKEAQPARGRRTAGSSTEDGRVHALACAVEPTEDSRHAHADKPNRAPPLT
jgi:hypothetical protein